MKQKTQSTAQRRRNQWEEFAPSLLPGDNMESRAAYTNSMIHSLSSPVSTSPSPPLTPVSFLVLDHLQGEASVLKRQSLAAQGLEGGGHLRAQGAGRQGGRETGEQRRFTLQGSYSMIWDTRQQAGHQQTSQVPTTRVCWHDVVSG